jgi:UDP-N-acetyl-D-mannosaminuronic acid dehydrogenase
VPDPWVESYPGVPIRSDLISVLTKVDAVVIFTGHEIYRNLKPADVKKLCGTTHPVIVDGRNVIDPDAFISNGFIYKGIGRGDKNQHMIAGL